ncbi:cyclic 2,3-diphosphoglycerate synthase [Desulfotalea psychrophila]|nr:cyclic 2,3-diphosphoglycerate synthase [Desulfotalea psychrophila]
MAKKVIIMGGAGRDFHNFNVYFKDNPHYEVVAFTAAPQIPGVEGRFYPTELAGKLYPTGIPIYFETELASLIRRHTVELVAFSYSDVPYSEVMHQASIAMAEDADFIMLGAKSTMLKSAKPVIAVCAVRTGCGKSQTTRKICEILMARGKRVVVVRHPMAYGDLGKQVVQRFSSYDDFARHRCSIEEREEYEHLVDLGILVFAGVDYQKILQEAEREADIIIWDGGNNDIPFFLPDIHIVLFDPHRPGHELLYYPGETNMLMADIAIINKVNTAVPEQIEQVRHNIELHAPQAQIILADSKITVSEEGLIKNKRVLVVEDGPTLTHGGMSYGAGMIAAEMYGAAEIVDPRPYSVGTLRETYEKYPHIGPLLPAMGYSPAQIADLEKTINSVACDLVLLATPIRLDRLLSINRPLLQVSYDYSDHGQPDLESILLSFLAGLIT